MRVVRWRGSPLQKRHNRVFGPREAGANPALSRNCNRGAKGYRPLKQFRKAARSVDPKARRPESDGFRPCLRETGVGPLRRGNSGNGDVKKCRGGTHVTRARRAAGTIFLALVALFVWAQPQGVYARGTAVEQQATLNALLYLHTQQSAANGSLDSSVAETGEFVVSAAIDGYDPNTLGNGGPTAMQYLASQTAKASVDAGDASWLIQAAVAAGDNPKDFGGVNLISSLQSLYSSTPGSSTNGEYNNSYDYGDAFGQSLAILALETAHSPVPAAALSYLETNQNSDGGWDFPVNDSDASGSDSNSTAMVLMALDGAHIHTFDAKAVAFQATLQQPDGGFAYQPLSPSDPDSDALVAQSFDCGRSTSDGQTVDQGRQHSGQQHACSADSERRLHRIRRR